ncbi:helix-turn-helix domain-containing protein [Plastoroseomonas hellenica]|uniref:helix-turn-helix domain-containing protein n=1 Tax=Plastoroseomonas hellenica TaxID=2687306 RepID=UPI001BA80C2A|nr:helix-turn-helix domain-containing protein [Plastoroseomonas hellenica]MBR0644021.1 transcriptional regulator [Plastoroseomonas hellenica]
MAAQGWHREKIKAELRMRHGNLTDLSVRWGYHRSSVSAAIDRADSPAIDLRIAEALNQHPHTLWPERWTPDGLRVPHPNHAENPSRSAPHSHRQKSEAA